MRPGWGGFWEAVENGLWIPLWARDVEWRGRRPSQKVKVLKRIHIDVIPVGDPKSQTFPEGKGVETPPAEPSLRD